MHAGGTREDKAEDVMSYIFSKCRNLVPSFDASTGALPLNSDRIIARMRTAFPCILYQRLQRLD